MWGWCFPLVFDHHIFLFICGQCHQLICFHRFSFFIPTQLFIYVVHKTNIFDGHISLEQVGKVVLGFSTTTFSCSRSRWTCSLYFDDIASDGCDIFIKVAQLCPDRVRVGIGVKIPFRKDDLEKEDPELSPIEDKFVRPEANFILSSFYEGIRKGEV